MAPNRKSISALVQTLSSNDLQSLQNTVQPKFLPLTHPKEAQQQHQHQQQQQIEQPQAQESVSYWDWSADDVVEEEVDIFSASNIESNLIQASNAATVTESPRLVASHDDYWCDQAQPSVVANKPQHIECSYWDWAADQDSQQATLQNIVVEERAYQLVSGATTQATEQSAQPIVSGQVHTQKESNDQYWSWESNRVATHTMDASHPNANYWDEQSDRQPVSPIAALLEYEVVRQLLQANTIVAQLQTSQAVPCATRAKVQADDYWSWSEDYGDQYWNTAPAAAAPIVSTGPSYWDW